MGRSLSAATLLLTALAPATQAQTLPTTSSPPVLLRLKFTPGQVLHYAGTLDITTVDPGGEPGSAGLTGMGTRTLMHQTVKAVRASDGAATVEVGVDTMSMTVNGKPVPVPPALLAQSRTLGTMVILPDGKVLSFTRPAGQDLMPALRGSDLGHANPLGSLGYFPDRAVKVGNTWESRIPSASSAVQAVARFTLTGVDTAGGRRIARIEFTTSGTTGAKFEGMKQVVTGEGRLRFDISAGAVVDQSSAPSFTTAIALRGDPKPSVNRGGENRTLTRVPAPR